MSGGIASFFKRLPTPASVANGVMNGATEAGQGLLSSAYSGLTLPGDVYNGKVDLGSEEGLARTLDMAGLMAGGSVPAPVPKGALRSFGGAAAKHADDPFAALEAALSANIEHVAPDVRPVSRVDPNAASWDLYHGTKAPTDFDRFSVDLPKEMRPHTMDGERGAVFLSPAAEEANFYAGGAAPKPGAEAGPRVIRTTVDPGKTAVFDIPHLLENDPTFVARSRQAFLEQERAGRTLTPGEDARNAALFDDRHARMVQEFQDARDLNTRLRHLGHPETEVPQAQWGYGTTSAAIQRAREQGLDTAVLRGLSESNGGDQVVALTPNRVRSYYDPSHTLYSGGPAGAAPGLAATSLGGDRSKPVQDPNLADALRASAARIGADPLDLATVISYETGGTFNPGIRGGAGNRHIGLIQFGPAEQQRYGANQGQSFAEQLGAVERYATDRGFKPGMGRMDLYSTINAGRPGMYGASDAGNGGAPGTVADKVNGQMGAHERKAAAFLGGSFTPAGPSPAAGGGQTPQAGTSLADALPGVTLPTLAPPAPMPSLADAFAPRPEVDALARQQRRQADDQRRQALLSVNAFGR